MHLERVCQSKLFKMMDQSEIKEILDTFHILKKDFEKDQVIVLEVTNAAL